MKSKTSEEQRVVAAERAFLEAIENAPGRLAKLRVKYEPPFIASAASASYEHPSALGLIPIKHKPEHDERNHLLGGFAELGEGEIAIVRVSLRHAPDGREQHRSYIETIKNGGDAGSGAGQIPLISRTLTSLPVSILLGLARGLGKLAGRGRGRGRGRDRSRPVPSPPQAPLPLSEESKVLIEHAVHKAGAGGAVFETVLTIAVTGQPDDKTRLAEIRHDLERGLHDIGHHSQRLQSLVWEECDGFDAVAGVLPVRASRAANSLRMSAEELSFFLAPYDSSTHPSGVSVLRAMKQLEPKNKQPIPDPFNPPAGLFPIGTINADSEDAYLHGLSINSLDKHFLGVGQTGSGKSEIIKHIVAALTKDDNISTIVIDPLGNLGNDLLSQLSQFRPDRIDDVVVIDLLGTPADLRGHDGLTGSFAVALNPLDISSEDEIATRQANMREMLETQMSMNASSHPRAINYTEQAITALLYANLILPQDCKLNLIHILPFLRDRTFRALVVKACPISSVHETFGVGSDFDRLPEKTREEHVAPLKRAFQPFVTNPNLANIFSASHNRLDWVRLIGEKKIVIVKLAGLSGESRAVSQLLGATLLPMLISTMSIWGRERDPNSDSIIREAGVRLVIDEAPIFITKADSPIVQALAVGRQRGFGILVFAQYAQQFPEEVRKALLNNTFTKVALVQEDPRSADEMARLMSRGTGLISGSDISNPDQYCGYAVQGDGGVFCFAGAPPLLYQALASGRKLKVSEEVAADRAAIYRQSWQQIGSSSSEMEERRRLLSVTFPETETEPERQGVRFASTAASMTQLALHFQARAANSASAGNSSPSPAESELALSEAAAAGSSQPEGAGKLSRVRSPARSAATTPTPPDETENDISQLALDSSQSELFDPTSLIWEQAQ